MNQIDNLASEILEALHEVSKSLGTTDLPSATDWAAGVCTAYAADRSEECSTAAHEALESAYKAYFKLDSISPAINNAARLLNEAIAIRD
jgi:hypothetical protein